MKMINTKVHGFIDYISWILLLVSPWMFEFASGKADMWIPFFAGIFILLQSLLTDYEFGLFKLISMKTHLVLDFATGIFLAASPWIFGFSDKVYVPHVFIGLLQVLVALVSEKEPYTDRPPRNFWIKRKNKVHHAE